MKKSIALFLKLFILPKLVYSHGYVKSPRSRNWVAKEDGVHNGGKSTDPEMETCPHCLNRNSGTCGRNNANDYDFPLNALGGPMPANIQATYTEGQEIELTVVLTAHHKGHFTYKACPIKEGEQATQSCFDSNPLVFLEDMLYPTAPKDPNFPERAYVANTDFSTYKDEAGAYIYTHKYKLPAYIVGDLVLIQWHYITANSCLPDGYHNISFPPGFHPGGNVGECSYPLSSNGEGAPEQFWNCIEVKINSFSPVAQPIFSPVHSPVATPVASPVTLLAGDGQDSRVIAYLGNWLGCPTDEQLDHYTHILIAFAVTYTWNPTKNICSDTCTIPSPVPVCNNSPNQLLVDFWRAKGKKVILSFGGAGMGGSWVGDVNNCWDYCYGNEQSVVNQLSRIVQNQNFDGVDSDYEYFYNTAPAQDFIRGITTGLRQTLANNKEITHAPMDPDLMPQTEYYKILKDIADNLDFIMPQYYNGYTRPSMDGINGTGVGSVSALSHYRALVDDMFNGDSTKVLFSFCITSCAGQATGSQAATIMSDLKSYYPCNGGAMFWMVSEDTGGSWSDLVSKEILRNKGCSSPGYTPVAPPVSSPVSAPVSSPVSAPVSSPVSAPVSSPASAPVSSPASAPVSSPVSAPVSIPVAFPTNIVLTCPAGFTGLYPMDRCTGFHNCKNGNVITQHILCPQGLLFNVDEQYCDWPENVSHCPV